MGDRNQPPTGTALNKALVGIQREPLILPRMPEGVTPKGRPSDPRTVRLPGRFGLGFRSRALRYAEVIRLKERLWIETIVSPPIPFPSHDGH